MFGLTGRGNKITVNSVWVIFCFGFTGTYMVVIGKRVQTSEKLIDKPKQELQGD